MLSFICRFTRRGNNLKIIINKQSVFRCAREGEKEKKPKLVEGNNVQKEKKPKLVKRDGKSVCVC